MSVSSIGGSSVSGLFSNQLSQMNQKKRPEDFDSTEDFVDSVLSNEDSDGDGSLSGDEIKENMRSPEGGMPPEGMGNAAASSRSESSSGEEGEEEYDEYDYNQDGVVTFDELQQAFASGDTSLEDVVGRRGDMNQQRPGEEGQSGQSILQRRAIRAYSDQTANASASSLLGSSV